MGRKTEFNQFEGKRPDPKRNAPPRQTRRNERRDAQERAETGGVDMDSVHRAMGRGRTKKY